MSEQKDEQPKAGWAALVPELSVSNLEKSLRFWRDVLGFSIAYQRPENQFAYLEYEEIQVMLDQDRGNWSVAALEKPFGRGINLQMHVKAVQPILDRLAEARWPLFEECHDAWYRVGDRETGCRQFLVQDPDGYLLRFSESLGLRPIKRDE